MSISYYIMIASFAKAVALDEHLFDKMLASVFRFDIVERAHVPVPYVDEPMVCELRMVNDSQYILTRTSDTWRDITSITLPTSFTSGIQTVRYAIHS